MRRPALPVAHVVLVILALGCGDGAGPEGTDWSLAVIGGDTQSAMVGAELPEPLRVRVTWNGKPLRNVTVRWSTSDGALSDPAPTDSNGVASAVWTLPRRQSSALLAQASIPDHGWPSVLFHASASFPSLEVVDGGGQQATVQTELPSPLRVRVTWQGTPLKGEAVHWSSNVEPVSERTDADGMASATWRLGTVAGVQTAQAALEGGNPPMAAFQATAKPGPLAVFEWQVSAPTTSSTIWIVGRTGELEVASRGLDAYGNGVEGVPFGFVLRSANGAVSEPISVVSSSDGRANAELPVSAAEAAADFSVEASIPGLGTFTTDIATVHFLWVGGDWYDQITPEEVTVQAGSIVRWGSMTPDSHFMKPMDGSDPGGSVSIGQVFEHRFDVPGTYVWYCAKHTYDNVPWEGTTTVIVTP